MINSKYLADKINNQLDVLSDLRRAYRKSKDIRFKHSAKHVIATMTLEIQSNMSVLKTRIAYGLK